MGFSLWVTALIRTIGFSAAGMEYPVNSPKGPSISRVKGKTVLRFPRVLSFAALTSCVVLGGCSILQPKKDPVPTLTLDQGSFRMTMTVGADGSILLAEHTPLSGRIEIAPILDAEGRAVETVQLLLHEGRYYITADGFKNLWEVSPQPGRTLATYRPIPVSENPMLHVRMARYGRSGRACVRLDAAGVGPWYVTDEGELHDQCP